MHSLLNLIGLGSGPLENFQQMVSNDQLNDSSGRFAVTDPGPGVDPSIGYDPNTLAKTLGLYEQ